MTRTGIDYAWSHPSPSAIRAAGYSFVCRYLSRDAAKNLTRPEASTLIAAGIDIVCDREATTSASLNGFVHAAGWSSFGGSIAS